MLHLLPRNNHFFLRPPEENVSVEGVLATPPVAEAALDIRDADGAVQSTIMHAQFLKVPHYLIEDHIIRVSGAPLCRLIGAHGLRGTSFGMNAACEVYSEWFYRT